MSWDHKLPRISSTFALEAGTLKARERDFIVREQEAYAAEGSGD